MSFLIKDDELLGKFYEIWEKIEKSTKREFGSEPVYHEKYLKAKIKSCNGKINTNFHNNEIPKESPQLTCLLVILIDSVFRMGKNYYPQVFLEDLKYVVKEKKMYECTTDDIQISSNESLMKKFLIKKVWMKKIKYRMCLVFVFVAFRMILGYS